MFNRLRMRAISRLQGYGWLLFADCAAVVTVAPWHRSDWSKAWVGVVAAALLCAPLFAWLLLPRTWRTSVGVALLAELAAVYLVSQVFLAGPIRPPMADWGIPFVGLAGTTCLIIVTYAPHQTRGMSCPTDKKPARRRPVGLSAAALLVTGAFSAWAAYQLALGDGAEPEAKVEPYRAEVLPLPDEWAVVDEEQSCGSGGCYGLTLTVTRERAGADPAGTLRQQLHGNGWSTECEPVGGLLRVLGFVDWGGHCVMVEVVGPTTAKIGINVYPGWPKGQS